MPRPPAILSAATAGTIAMLAIGACSRQPEASSPNTSQPETVVTSRSDGKAIPNPRRGSYKKSEGGTWGYTTPGENTAPSAKR